MGIELANLDIEELESILYEVAKGNTKDMSTFRELLQDMYGGLDINKYRQLEQYIRNELGLQSDAELYNMDMEQKNKIIAYLQ